MKWNWIKINIIKDLPDFNKSVMLYEFKDDKHFAMVGNLKSIDAKGWNWNYTGIGNSFKPTHWCEIIIP